MDPWIGGIAAIVVLSSSFLFAMLGLGGGMVYVPVLHWLGFDLEMVAIPLGLLLNGLNTLLALIPYGKAGLVDWRGGWPMGLAAVIGAPVGALALPYVPRRELLAAFALAVLLAAVRMLWIASREEPTPDAMMPLARRATLGSVAGLGIGFFGGLLGIGGGFLVAPLLLWMGYSTKAAAATTAMVVTFSSFSGFAGHAAQGSFPLVLTLVAGVAVVVGSQGGARLMMAKAKAGWIRRFYAVVLLVITAKLLWEVLAVG